MGISPVVALPVFGVLKHFLLQHNTNVGSFGIGNPLLFNASQAENSFTHGKRELGSDLENRKMPANKLLERVRGLVVSRMSFKDDPLLTQDPLRQLLRILWHIIGDALIAELYSWLHYDSDNPLPGGCQSASLKGLAMHIERPLHAADTGDRNLQFALRASWRGHFRTHDVDRELCSIRRNGFRQLAHTGSALRDRGIAHNFRIVSAPHACIQVKLCKSGTRKSLNHDSRLFHGLVRRL